MYVSMYVCMYVYNFTATQNFYQLLIDCIFNMMDESYQFRHSSGIRRVNFLQKKTGNYVITNLE